MDCWREAVCDLVVGVLGLLTLAWKWASYYLTVEWDPLDVASRPIRGGFVVVGGTGPSSRARRAAAWLYRWHEDPGLEDWEALCERAGLPAPPVHTIQFEGDGDFLTVFVRPAHARAPGAPADSTPGPGGPGGLPGPGKAPEPAITSAPTRTLVLVSARGDRVRRTSGPVPRFQGLTPEVMRGAARREAN